MMADYCANDAYRPDVFSTKICGKRSSYVITHSGIESEESLRNVIESSTVFVPDYICLPSSVFNSLYPSRHTSALVNLFGHQVRVVPIETNHNSIILRGNKFQSHGNLCLIAVDSESVFESISAEKNILVTQYRVDIPRLPFPAIMACHKCNKSKVVMVSGHETFVKIKDIPLMVGDTNNIALDIPEDVVYNFPDLPVDLVFVGAR